MHVWQQIHKGPKLLKMERMIPERNQSKPAKGDKEEA